jgi:hypothetical protein
MSSVVRQVPLQRRSWNSSADFLKAIGRGCSEFSDKFPTWDSLFTADSTKLKELGIPTRPRKWILIWINKYR